MPCTISLRPHLSGSRSSLIQKPLFRLTRMTGNSRARKSKRVPLLVNVMASIKCASGKVCSQILSNVSIPFNLLKRYSLKASNKGIGSLAEPRSRYKASKLGILYANIDLLFVLLQILSYNLKKVLWPFL